MLPLDAPTAGAARERRRRDAIALLEAGWSQAAVARHFAVSREAVRKWHDAWKGGGSAALAARPRPGAPPRVARAALRRLPELLGEETPATTRAVGAIIEAEFGVSYHPNHVRRLAARLGIPLPRRNNRSQAEG